MVPKGINASGLVVGEATDGAGTPRAFSSLHGAMLDLGGTVQEHAEAVNNSGAIAGYESAGAGLSETAVQYSSGQAIALPGFLVHPPSGIAYVNRVTGVNDIGQVIGYMQVGSQTWGMTYFPNLMKWYQIRPVTPAPGVYGLELAMRPAAVNLDGCVTGSVGLGGFNPLHAFFSINFFQPTEDLGTLNPGDPGTISAGTGININDWIVGYSTKVAGGQPVAFLYNRISMIDLNTRLLNGAGWQLVSANAINDYGQIAGQGVHNGRMEAFVLLPRRMPIISIDPCPPLTYLL